ncbi:hypothetical protein BMS3Abin05_00367 [bacterium BMS3Abin05]|nr:hypothetical protein BMS3Abin05_00367 [bacterium BMS3Abin05]
MLVRDKIRIAESFLYHIWDGGHLKKELLQTTAGKRVEIISKGKWNVDSGPDFREAILKMDGELMRGDVEIHTQESDWFAHKHQDDPKYENVILHAVLWANEKSSPAVTRSGREISTLILSDFLDESLERLQVRVEKESYLEKEKPSICLLGKRTAAEISETLDYWGLERIRVKKERFREELNYFNYDQLIYQGIMEALGYSKNQRQFLKLALKMPVEAMWEILQSYSAEKRVLVAQALLLGAAGFLEETSQKTPVPHEYVRTLQKMWGLLSQTFEFEPLPKHEWQFFRLRPANFPTVRIAGMASLVVKFSERGFHAGVLDLFNTENTSFRQVGKHLRDLFMAPAQGYWENHFQLQNELSRHSRYRLKHLIGTSRSNEIMVNVIFPILMVFADETGDEALSVKIKEAYLYYPKLQENEIIRAIKVQVLSPNEEKLHLVHSAARQQGLIHIYKSFCRSWKCSECMQAIKENTRR